jgi:drug/metabolite transporter (DMT)-like permease
VALALAAVTALTWGTMEVIFLRAAKGIGAFSLVLWLAIMGTVIALPIALLTGRPEGTTGELAAALGAAALGFGAGALYFVALQHGQLSVVSPIVATQAAVAALAAALLLDEPLGAALVGGLLVVLVGTVLAAGGRGAADHLAIVLAVGSAIGLGLYAVALGETADAIGGMWAVVAYRVVTLAVLLPLAVRHARLHLPQAHRRPLVIAVLLETIGFIALAYALAEGPVGPVAAIAVQYSTVAVVGAAVVLHERLRPSQWLGVGLVLAAVLVISLSREV